MRAASSEPEATELYSDCVAGDSLPGRLAMLLWWGKLVVVMDHVSSSSSLVGGASEDFPSFGRGFSGAVGCWTDDVRGTLDLRQLMAAL